MKVYLVAYRNNDLISLMKRPPPMEKDGRNYGDVICTLEVDDVKKPEWFPDMSPKTDKNPIVEVTREAMDVTNETYKGSFRVFAIPKKAKHVKCVYDIDVEVAPQKEPSFPTMQIPKDQFDRLQVFASKLQSAIKDVEPALGTMTGHQELDLSAWTGIKPKKMVTKELRPGDVSESKNPLARLEFYVPSTAVNVRCLYDVEQR